MNKLSSVAMGLLIPVFFSLNSEAQDFKMIKATSQKWTAGVRGGGGGTKYELTFFSLKPSSKIKFGDIFIGGKKFPVNIIVKSSGGKYSGASVNPEFSANDTLIIRASEFIKGERIPDENRQQEKPDLDSVTATPPKKYTGDALLCYKSGKKKKYFVIEKFEVLPRLNYP